MQTARTAVCMAGVRYKRHQPELILLYQIIETYYPEFLTYIESQGKILPTHIKKFDAYLKCDWLEQGFYVCAVKNTTMKGQWPLMWMIGRFELFGHLSGCSFLSHVTPPGILIRQFKVSIKPCKTRKQTLDKTKAKNRAE